MTQILLTMNLGGQRDVVRARQRTRQITGLLGYEITQQAALSATVFHLAHQVLAECMAASLVFAVDDGCLRVTPVPVEAFRFADSADVLSLIPPASTLQLRQPLPPREDALPPLDLAWVARELHRRTPLNLFEEIHRQNQELLALLLQLKAARQELLHPGRSNEPAA